MSHSLLLVDMSNLVISSSMSFHSKTGSQVDNPDTIRNIFFDAFLFWRKKVKGDEVVLSFDGRNYWRKDFFPNYKINRVKTKKESSFDWSSFYDNYQILIDELRDNFSFTHVKVDGAEADDVIASMVLKYSNERDITILSSDKDFLQLQRGNRNVRQYSTRTNKWLTADEYNLVEHIIRGDAVDGIPNVLSNDDAFLVGKRQPSITKKFMEKVESCCIEKPEDFCTSYDMLKRFERNKKLIDLREIPNNIIEDVVSAYTNYKPSSSKAFNYLTKNRLSRFLTDVDLLGSKNHHSTNILF